MIALVSYSLLHLLELSIHFTVLLQFLFENHCNTLV